MTKTRNWTPRRRAACALGTAALDYAFDVLCVAEQLGWERFALLGHSLGAIVSVVIAGSFPERVTRMGLIDGIVARSGPEGDAAERMGQALQAQLDLEHKRKSVHPTLDRAVEARMKGLVAVSREVREYAAISFPAGRTVLEGGLELTLEIPEGM